MQSRTGIFWASVLLLAAGLAGGVCAQTLYKSVDQNGKVIYSDKPSPNAATVKEIEAPPAPAPRSPAQIAQEAAKLQKESKQADQRGRERASASKDKQAEIDAAVAALNKAQTAKASGVEPRDGEVISTASGRRYTDAYNQRQEALARDVVEAQKRVDRAYANAK